MKLKLLKILYKIYKHKIKYKYMLVIYLYLFGIVSVYYLNGGILDTPLYESDIITIDYWFFIHIFNNICVSKFYPYKLTKLQFLVIPIEWEFIENILLPSIGFTTYREDPKDIFGDLLTIIPAYILL